MLFLAFSVFNGDEKAVGFSVSVNGEDIFSLDYDDAEHYFSDDKFGGIIEVSVEEGKIIVYLSPDKKEYNVIRFDCAERTVIMEFADCSPTHDCTYFGKISEKGSIVCAPHGLIITAKSGSFVPSPPITG